MPARPPSDPRHHDLDKQWYGWGSPVGLGLLLLCLAVSVAAVLAAVSLLA
jgi:hypothetical protein